MKDCPEHGKVFLFAEPNATNTQSLIQCMGIKKDGGTCDHKELVDRHQNNNLPTRKEIKETWS